MALAVSTALLKSALITLRAETYVASNWRYVLQGLKVVVVVALEAAVVELVALAECLKAAPEAAEATVAPSSSVAHTLREVTVRASHFFIGSLLLTDNTKVTEQNCENAVGSTSVACEVLQCAMRHARRTLANKRYAHWMAADR